MTLDPVNLAAILVMAAATYLTRLTGYWIAGRLALRGRARAAVQAIPASVLVAVIAPMIAGGGAAGLAAALLTGLAAWRGPMVLAVAVGVASAALFRNLLG
jgi:uncharacterized membrane protein